MRNNQLALGGMLLVGLVGVLAFPKVRSKGRRALRSATGTTYRDGVSAPGVRATADPARGLPA